MPARPLSLILALPPAHLAGTVDPRAEDRILRLESLPQVRGALGSVRQIHEASLRGNWRAPQSKV